MRINPISFGYDRSVKRFDRVHNPFIQPMKCDSVHFTGNTVQSKKVIMLLGAPNSGKGTFGRELAKKYGEDSSKNFVNGILASIVKE